MIIEFTNRLIGFFVFLTLSISVSAQSVTETHWYFGNSAENLIFDGNGRNAYLQTNQATSFGMGGASVITDQITGNLLFYSDGTQIFDAGHNLLTNALSGNPSINVAVASAPDSGNPGQYYFFSNAYNLPTNEIQYTIVDANVVGNGSAMFSNGAVSSMNNSTGLINPSEGMLIVPEGDGINFWLISQDRTTFEYRVTQINPLGIGATTRFDFTSSAVGAEISHFSFNANSSFLAVAPKTANRNVRILSFDIMTGSLSFEREILNTGFDDGQGESVYDVEWSNDGSKLYLSRFGSGATDGNIYQYDLTNADDPIQSILTTPIHRSYGLQRGIDGRIYHLHQITNTSNIAIGRINQPDSLISVIDYVEQVFSENFAGFQFPNFSAAYGFTFTTLDFTYLDSCQNGNTKFFPLVNPAPQHYSWDFSGGSTSNNLAPIINFSMPGMYHVELTVTTGDVTRMVMKGHRNHHE